MSDAPDRDLLAAEYVLGTLEGEDGTRSGASAARRPGICRGGARMGSSV